jgi:hypothetical protein
MRNWTDWPNGKLSWCAGASVRGKRRPPVPLRDCAQHRGRWPAAGGDRARSPTAELPLPERLQIDSGLADILHADCAPGLPNQLSGFPDLQT